MVSIEPFPDEPAKAEAVTDAPPLASEERYLDAEDIEKALPHLKRPTAKMQLESLVKKLRKEASALKVVEATNTGKTTTAAAEDDVKKAVPEQAPPPAATPRAPVPATMPPPTPSVQFITIDPFSFDAGGSMDQFVTLYLPLPGVGSIPKENVKCIFGKDDFDCTIMDLKGKNYRLKKDNLEHDIVPDKSKFVVKANKVLVKLAKVKGEYGSYDFWSKLTDPKKKEKEAKKKETSSNPMAGLNDLMREMYESGDDKTRKMIGETLLKQRNGELGKDAPGMGGGMDDMGLGDFGSGFDDDDE